MNHNLDTLLNGLYISPHTAFCEWGGKAVYKDTASHCHERPCCAASCRTVNTKHVTCLFVFCHLTIYSSLWYMCHMLCSYFFWDLTRAHIFHHKSINSFQLSANTYRYKKSYNSKNTVTAPNFFLRYIYVLLNSCFIFVRSL